MKKFHVNDTRENMLFDALDSNASTRQAQLIKQLQSLQESLSSSALKSSTAEAVQSARQLDAFVQRARAQTSEVAAALHVSSELSNATAPVLNALAGLRSDIAGLRADNAQLRVDNEQLRLTLRDILANQMQAQQDAKEQLALKATKTSCKVQ